MGRPKPLCPYDLCFNTVKAEVVSKIIDTKGGHDIIGITISARYINETAFFEFGYLRLQIITV